MLSKPDKNGEVQVQVGIIKLSVRLDDIRLSNEKTEKKTNVKVEYNPANTVGLELDIRGMLVDEAKPIVDKYLLDAHLQGLSEVNIIHGKGTGCASAPEYSSTSRTTRIAKRSATATTERVITALPLSL